ncbi:MAG: EAL domain-containing protein [Gammaproteobacteria bacterium]|nr:EAL domain-containing protein [Gammaproteobacteria bacterium]
MGSISFLALEAIGASIAILFGFTTAFWAILTASVIIFLTAIPISYYAARYNIDIDLITRSAGFGYVGSTITSLIYASFSFIFFALEAAILAQGLELYFALPLAWGYLLSSLIIIPLVFYGITLINKLQLWTQPVWIIMMIAPFIAVLLKEPEAVNAFLNFSGTVSENSEFSFYYFGFAVGISLSLIAQIGEQVDYLRFMPPLQKNNRIRWWSSLLLAGPGWIILGFLKQIGGIFLAAIVLLTGLSISEAKTPVQMYYIGYQYIFDNPEIALLASTLFVIVSQIKINVTNAYAGSLAWSNFFSRVTHSHPGRVVWMIFNISIALLLMEMGVFNVLEKVLGLYSNVAIAWIGAIVADLIINKPFGLSPKAVEFKRAHLYNINPVGVGSMGIASIVAILSFIGLLGEMAQSYSSLIALFLALLLSPLIAFLTGGRYYIARQPLYTNELHKTNESHVHCEVCEKSYEKEDMAYCPHHNVSICSLCCSLDSLCHDACKVKSEQELRQKIGHHISQLLGKTVSSTGALRIFDFIGISSLLFFIVAIIAWLIFSIQTENIPENAVIYLKEAFIQFFLIIGVLISVITWWILLLQESRQRAEVELEEQNKSLEEEIEIRREAELKAHHLANYDSLTLLPNRNLMYSRIEQEILQCKRERKRFALLFLDLDRFKVINDTLGHESGDLLLKSIASRLKKCIRESDSVSRQGGDEFIVLLRNFHHTKDVAHIAKSILSSMEKSHKISGHDIHSTFSIGISLYPDDGENMSTLFKHADIAMYQVKTESKNNFKFFNPLMEEHAISNLIIEHSLRQAINKNQLLLHYQPQLCYGEIIGLEALVRWQHPEKGLLYPASFIAIAEESDLIVKLGKWVLMAACQQGAKWIAKGYQAVPIAVNVSKKQFEQKDFVHNIQDILARTHFPAELLELELTERIIMHNTDEAIQQLQVLKNLGLSLSIDDFGTGYSSLSYLKTLPVDKLKIDISFVRNIVSNQADEAIVKTIINLAQNLNLKVLAEGVETKEQLQLLEKIGTPAVQGRLFYPGLTAKEISHVFASQS